MKKVIRDGLVAVRYTCIELQDDIKTKVLEAHEAKACEYDDWYSEIYDTTRREMLDKGIDIDYASQSASCGIRFTGFGSQGDGASFTGRMYLKEFLEAHQDILREVPELYHMLGTAGQQPLVDVECSLSRVSSRYYHEKTVEFRWDVTFPYHGEHLYTKVNAYMSCIRDDIQDICRGYMKDLYAKLSTEYDYLQSEQCLVDNDLRYTADGEEVW